MERNTNNNNSAGE